jgi:leader peptidase (prepilin peptidase)/N-methyltransferase
MLGVALCGRIADIDASSAALLAASPIIGSFLGTIILRLPEGEPILLGRSRCAHCGAQLAARDLVPLLSWLLARGRCRHCGKALGWFYPGIEAAAVALALVSLSIDSGLLAWVDWLLGCWLLTLGWIDLRRWLLPDALTLPLILVGLGAAAWLAPGELVDRAAGAAGGYLILRATAWAYRRQRGREGVGGGDAKLLAAAGAWVGAAALPSVLFGAACAALMAAAGLAIAGTRLSRDSALPFGPFLALAIWVVWLLGPLPF